jgi:hypothetical protein
MIPNVDGVEPFAGTVIGPNLVQVNPLSSLRSIHAAQEW